MQINTKMVHDMSKSTKPKKGKCLSKWPPTYWDQLGPKTMANINETSIGGQGQTEPEIKIKYLSSRALIV